MTKLKNAIVLAAGGTGGHVFPAQALAKELKAEGYDVFILTDNRGYQFDLKGVSHIKIPAAQLGGSIDKKIKGSFKLMAGIAVALCHLRRLKPAVVVGFGGYASLPTMLAAIVLRIPTIIHQADAYFGRANRVLAPFVTRIATSFPHVENIPPSCQQKVSYTGLPVRSDIKFASYSVSKGKQAFHLLITGGSQGAKVFGEVIPQGIALLDTSLQKQIHVHQQCRPEFLDRTQALYAKTKAQVELAPFLKSMGDRYKKAHLFISRAGASSVLEAALVGRPALFIPYPYAMDDHQIYNAQEAVKAKGAWMMREKEFTPEALCLFLSSLMASPQKLEKAAANIQTIAIIDATLRLTHLVKMIAA